ncbi:unnamed protein product [Coccothraustes coccothraustes]
MKSCRAAIYCGGNKLQDEIQALRDLFSTSLFAKESTEMTLRIFKLELCGGRMHCPPGMRCRSQAAAGITRAASGAEATPEPGQRGARHARGRDMSCSDTDSSTGTSGSRRRSVS